MLLVTVITYILNLLDLVFTLHLAKEYGDDIEGNPIGKLLLRSKAVTIAVKVLMAIPLAVLYIMHSHIVCRIILWVVFAAYTALTAYHVFIVVYLKKHDL